MGEGFETGERRRSEARGFAKGPKRSGGPLRPRRLRRRAILPPQPSFNAPGGNSRRFCSGPRS